MTLQELQQLNLPDTPGVYIFKDQEGKILYIGRATSLKSRVRSYFDIDLIRTRGPLLVDMITKSHTVEWREVRTVLESVILEANFIKEHQPYYNTKEKDDKSFYFVAFTKDKFPQVLLVRKTDMELPEYKKCDYYGPYPSGPIIREALKILRRIFPFRSTEAKVKHHEEFYKQLGLAPDTSSEEAERVYKAMITRLKRIFAGQLPAVIADLEKEMNQAAKDWNFERAQKLKSTVYALTHLKDVSLIKEDRGGSKTFKIESYDIAHLSGTSIVGVMTVVRDGVAYPKGYKKFKIRTKDNADDPGSLEEVLVRRLKHSEWHYPDLIVVDGNMVQRNRAVDVISRFNLTIPVVAVTKDQKHQPKVLLGDETIIKEHKRSILLANAESHRFAVSYLRQRKRKETFTNLVRAKKKEL